MTALGRTLHGRVVDIRGPVLFAALDRPEQARDVPLWQHLDVASHTGRAWAVVHRNPAGLLACVRAAGPSDDASPTIGAAVRAGAGEGMDSLDAASLAAVISAVVGSGIAEPGVASSAGAAPARTGLKAVDLACPVPDRGAYAMLGGHGSGRMAFRMELVDRLAHGAAGEPSATDVMLCFVAEPEDARGVRQMAAGDARVPADVVGPTKTWWLVSDSAKDPGLGASLPVASSAYFSPILAACDLFPALDAVWSTTRLHALARCDLVSAIASARRIAADVETLELVALGQWRAAKERDALATSALVERLPPPQREAVVRGRRVERYLTQWFRVLRGATGHAGPWVDEHRAVADVRAILAGAADGRAEGDLEYIGCLDEVAENDGARRFW